MRVGERCARLSIGPSEQRQIGLHLGIVDQSVFWEEHEHAFAEIGPLLRWVVVAEPGAVDATHDDATVISGQPDPVAELDLLPVGIIHDAPAGVAGCFIWRILL